VQRGVSHKPNLARPLTLLKAAGPRGHSGRVRTAFNHVSRRPRQPTGGLARTRAYRGGGCQFPCNCQTPPSRRRKGSTKLLYTLEAAAFGFTTHPPLESQTTPRQIGSGPGLSEGGVVKPILPCSGCRRFLLLPTFWALCV